MEETRMGAMGTESTLLQWLLDPVFEKYGLTLRESALRWSALHSLFGGEKGDAVLLGASSAKHSEGNFLDLEKGPLPDEVVGAFERG